MADNKLLSKLTIGGVTYDLKDAANRAALATLEARLGTAAYEAYQASWDATKTAEIPSVGAVKSYVDAQIATIPEFDVVVVTSLPEASKDTFHKIYLLKKVEEGQNKYAEYITIHDEAHTPKYYWEKLGDIEVDLSNYVQKDTKIAGLEIGDGIAKADLQAALELGEMAYADTASGSDTVDTIDTITMNDVTVAGNATVTNTDAEAVLDKMAYKPAGSITGSAISGGSINVTLKDAETATNAVIAASSTFTPAGTVAAVDGGNFQALKSAAFQADDAGVQIEGTVSAPAVTLTSSEANVAIGVKGGSVASINTAKFSGGSFTGASAASFTQGSKASFEQGSKASFDKGSAVAAAVEAIVVDSYDEESETLSFKAATTHNVIGHSEAVFTTNGNDTFVANGDDSFTPNVVGTFAPAAIADGFFTPNVLQEADMGTVNNVTAAALANAPVFTGAKYKVATTADTALKEVAFEATNNVSVPTQITYVKQAVDAKTFTPVAADLGFAGTEVADLIPTKVTYKKADANAAFSETVTPSVKAYNRTAKAIEITATPDGE